MSKEVNTRLPKKGTIGRFVLLALARNPSVTCDQLIKRIKMRWGDSRFNPAHLAWYRHQVKKGRYVLPKGKAIRIEQGEQEEQAVQVAQAG